MMKTSPINPILLDDSENHPHNHRLGFSRSNTDILMFHFTRNSQKSSDQSPYFSQPQDFYYSHTSKTLSSSLNGNIRKVTTDWTIHPKGGDDLYAVLRMPIIIGACFGLIPIRGLREECFHPDKQVFGWKHIRTLITIIVTFLIFLNTFFITHSFFIGIISKQNNSAGSLVLSFSGVWFYTAGTLVYAFFLLRSKRLCAYFGHWVKVSEQICDTLQPDWNICRDVNLICILVLLDCLAENTLFHFHAMRPQQRGRMGSLTFEEVLRDYYNSNQYIFPFFNYSPAVTLGLLFTNKLATYAWNFGDIFLMIFSRALYARYASLNSFIESLMVPDGSVCLIKKGTVSWANVRRNFLLITKLLEEGNQLLSPLIWLSYITDIFFVCRQLYEGLAPSANDRYPINKVYMAWSLFHLIIRTIGVNWMAAKICESAHKISKILQHCYPEEYDDDVRRLERYLSTKIIGITGNGCFIITRSFILMVGDERNIYVGSGPSSER
ncbi:Gustatory receptor for sugar taste 64a [Folsomia candida]|uniref:Gustatory receptor for sugar taste 64a n=1 Tax=Folsomia candida TaxID=158441 RepID=A0A226EIE0_FOLCA|nr:Gustatory receptor for sugar taste 64a [Folsomia candida]